MALLDRRVLWALALLSCSCGPFEGGGPDACSGDCTLEAPDAGLDSGVRDAGALDAGGADAGPGDAGGADAGGLDAGSADGGPRDAGGLDGGGGADAGPRELLPAALAPLDAGVLVDDAGMTLLDLTARAAPVPLTAVVPSFGQGRLFAVSAQSLLLAEGPLCEVSEVNLYSCDYRWVGNSGAVQATVSNALGKPHRRGELILLYGDVRTECLLNGRPVRSVEAGLYALDTGADLKRWPRDDLSGAPALREEGDVVSGQSARPACDGGLQLRPGEFTLTQAPQVQLVGKAILELGAGRVLLQDGAGALLRREADAGVAALSLQTPPGGLNWSRDLDVLFFGFGSLGAGTQHYQQGVDGGPVVPVATVRSPALVVRHGGRFALVADPTTDPDMVRALDTQGLVPDLRYPTTARHVLLQRAPLLVGTHPNGQLLVGRLDQGAAALLPIRVFSIDAFPSEEAALVLDLTGVAWRVDRAGVHRVASQVVRVQPQRLTAPRVGPSVLSLARSSNGALELDVVDDVGGRLVVLSRQLLPRGPSVDSVEACEVPGLLGPGGDTFFFAEATSVPGQVELFAARSDFTQPARSLGLTDQVACVAPVVSRDGARVGVQRKSGAGTRIDVGTW